MFYYNYILLYIYRIYIYIFIPILNPNSAILWSLCPQDRRRRIAAGCCGRGVCIRCSDVVIVPSGTTTWVCLKMSCTPKPNGFADHYPYSMAISLGIYPIFRQTHLGNLRRLRLLGCFGNYLKKWTVFWDVLGTIDYYYVIFFGGSANPSDQPYSAHSADDVPTLWFILANGGKVFP